MAIEIKVPALGESVTEATVGQWFKQPGDAVNVDEPLVELETDKVTVGAVLGAIDGAGTRVPAASTAPAAPPSAPPPPAAPETVAAPPPAAAAPTAPPP